MSGRSHLSWACRDPGLGRLFGLTTILAGPGSTPPNVPATVGAARLQRRRASTRRARRCCEFEQLFKVLSLPAACSALQRPSRGKQRDDFRVPSARRPSGRVTRLLGRNAGGAHRHVLGKPRLGNHAGRAVVRASARQPSRPTCSAGRTSRSPAAASSFVAPGNSVASR